MARFRLPSINAYWIGGYKRAYPGALLRRAAFGGAEPSLLRHSSPAIIAGSVSLRADALDFLADAANYAVALAVFAWRYSGARDALPKGCVMGLFGLPQLRLDQGRFVSCAWRIGSI